MTVPPTPMKLHTPRSWTVRLSPIAVIALLVLVAAAPRPGHGQSFERVEEMTSNINSYYYHVRPGAASIEVYAMGTIGAPGIYRIEEDTNLKKLLALSGGPVLNPRMQRTNRRITVRVYRAGADDPVVYEAEFEGAITRSTESPTLRNGDIVTVQIVESEPFQWRDVLNIVTATTTVGLMIGRIARTF